MSLDELKQILLSDKPSDSIKENEDRIFEMIPKFKLSKNFNQHNKWHIYDVYEHTLHVIDGVENDFELRLSALFHDMGKPIVYFEDKNSVGHFPFHWVESLKIFNDFLNKYPLDETTANNVRKLIFFHDINIKSLNNEEMKEFLNSFNNVQLLKKLFSLKKADLMAQNPDFQHYMLEIEELEDIFLNRRKH